MEMAFSHLGYSPNGAIGTNQSPVTSNPCEPLGNLLSSYSSSLSPPDNHLVGLYNPAYAAAAAQSRFFSLGSPTGPSPPGIPPNGPVCPTSAQPPTSMTGMVGVGPPEPTSFYPGYPVSRDMTSPWRAAGPTGHFATGPHSGYPYDHTSWQTAYAYPGSHALDLNGTRRKNATRESTATLKAWLQEHIKNPYPTKGEKIMLAIITKMTLTQVSTWFANARRRLKKENKMTWSPRNRTDDGDMDDGSSRDGVDQEAINGGGGVTGANDSSVGVNILCGVDRNSAGMTDVKDSSPERLDDCHKPKIWSLAMTATSCGTFSFHGNNNHLQSSTGLNSMNTKSLHSGSGLAGGCMSPLGLSGQHMGHSGGMSDHLSMKQAIGSSPPPHLHMGHLGSHFFPSSIGGMPISNQHIDSNESM